MGDSIGLAEFLSQVRAELLQQEGDGPNGTPLLALEQVDLELQISISKDASGRVKVYVVDAGGGIKREDVHTVKLSLQPLLTREERVAELRQRADWNHVVDVALSGTLKSADATNNQRDD